MLVSCTLKNGFVYLPTVAKTEAGFYIKREPVAVVRAVDTGGLRRALRDVLAKENIVIPAPKRDAFPPSVLLKYTGEKTWAAFMRGASEWDIYEKDGNYQITPYQKDPQGGQSWVPVSDGKITFPSGVTANDVIERMIAIVQDVAGQ
jgi:hypothetical protein